MLEYTKEQKKIIRKAVKLYVNGKNEILKINAFAGTGKTTTMLAAIEELVNAGAKNILYLIFNKHMQLAIEKKLKEMKLNKQVKAKTINALAYHYARRKGFRHIHNIFDEGYVSNYAEYKEYQNFCKFHKEGTNEVYEKLKYYKELDFAGEVRFLADNAANFKYDVIVLDEAQDTNPCMLTFFAEAKAKLKILVGDSFQSIYLFNGAINAIRKIKTKKSNTLNLTISFRVRNTQIQNLANRILHYLKPDTPEFLINSEKRVEDNTTVYLMRTNSGVVNTLNTLLAKDEDKEIGVNVTPEMINVLDDLVYMFYTGHSKKFKKITLDHVQNAAFAILAATSTNIGDENENNIDSILYDYALFYRMTKGNVYTLKEYKDLLQTFAVAADKAKTVDIYITTVHKYKGMEAPKVYIDVEGFRKILIRYLKTKNIVEASKKKIVTEYIKQEYNLLYIAITRAFNKIINYAEVEQYVRIVTASRRILT